MRRARRWGMRTSSSGVARPKPRRRSTSVRSLGLRNELGSLLLRTTWAAVRSLTARESDEGWRREVKRASAMRDAMTEGKQTTRARRHSRIKHSCHTPTTRTKEKAKAVCTTDERKQSRGRSGIAGRRGAGAVRRDRVVKASMTLKLLHDGRIDGYDRFSSVRSKSKVSSQGHVES